MSAFFVEHRPCAQCTTDRSSLASSQSGSSAPTLAPSHKFSRRKASVGAKKVFAEFFEDGTLTLMSVSGSLLFAENGQAAPSVVNKMSASCDVQVIGASSFLLLLMDEETWELKAESSDVANAWTLTIGKWLAKKNALQDERRKVLAAISRSNLTASQEAARELDRQDAILESASEGDKADMYQFLSLLSPTYISSFDKVPDSVRNVSNELFQRLSVDETVMDFENPTPQKKRLAVSLISLVEDFLETARHYGRIIVSEVFIPTKEKTIKPVSVGGVIGGEKFIVGNILYKFAIDVGVFGGDHASAAKVAGLELQGLRAYHSTQTNGLHFPLMAMIDKKGFRLIASALLPLKELIYGSNDAAFTIHRDNADMNKLVEKASAALNVKPHKVGLDESASKLMYSCVDLEGHMGADGRFYLLDFSRAMPPVTPTKNKPNSHLFEMFRPEFVAKYRAPLSSDAYSRFTMAQEDFQSNNEEIDAAVKTLFDNTIPAFAETFRDRFAYYKKVNVDLTKFRLSALMHEKGINVRYMGQIVQRLVGESGIVSGGAAVVGFLDLLDDEEGKKRYGDVQKEEDETDLRPEDFVCMEMVARAAKNIVRSRLRFMMEQLRVPVDEPFKGVVIKTLNELFSLSKDSQEFWADVLLPSVEKTFGIALKTLYKGVNTRKALFKRDGVPFLMWNRLCDMLGLEFAPTIRELLQSEPGIFDSPTVFSVTDLADLGDRVKKLDFTSVAEGYLAAVNAAEMEDASLYDLAELQWKKAEAHFSEALMHRPDDASFMVLVARVLTRLARLTNATSEHPMMIRALTLTARAAKLAHPSQVLEVKLARAAALEACGMVEESEMLFIQTVLSHTESVYCISAYTKFLKKRGDEGAKMANTIEEDVRRKTCMDLSQLVKAAQGSKTSSLRQLTSPQRSLNAARLMHVGGQMRGFDRDSLTQAATNRQAKE